MDNQIIQQAISDIKAGMPIAEFGKYYPELNNLQGVFIQYASDVKAGMPDSEAPKHYPELFGQTSGLNNQPNDIQSKKPVPGGKVGNFIVGVGNRLAETAINLPGNIAKIGGLGATAMNKLFGASDIQEKITKPAIEMVNQKEQATAQRLKPENTAQKAGSIAADVAMFFIPAGAEAKAIKSVDALLDTAKLVQTFGSKAGLVKNIVKAATAGGITGTSAAGITGLEGGNAKDITQSALWGGIAGAAAKAFSLAAPTLLNSLAKSSFKLTPSMEAKAASKVESAAKFVSDNNLSVNPKTQFQQATTIVDQFEDTMKKSLTNKVGISPEELITELQKIPIQFKDEPAIYQQVVVDVKKAIKTIQETHGYNINLDSLLSGKRSYGKAAFGKSSPIAKATGAISEADYAIEKAYENVLESALSRSKGGVNIPLILQKYFGGKTQVSLEEFNKVYSQAINAKKFSNLAQFKSDSHLVGRLLGLWVGETIGSALVPGLGGKIGGAVVGEALSNRATSILRPVGKASLKGVQKILVPAVKTSLGMSKKD